MPVTRKHTTRATSLNLADLPALSDCFGRITRHSERAAADRPERDQERETRQGLENHMSEKSPTVPGAGQQRPRRPLDGTGVRQPSTGPEELNIVTAVEAGNLKSFQPALVRAQKMR